MKKVFYSLILFCGLSACSSEKVSLEPLRIYDVANSNCKLSISPTDTHVLTSMQKTMLCQQY